MARVLVPLFTGAARLFDRGATPNDAQVREGLELEHWDAVADGRHNLTTDLTRWRGYFYLVHASSPWHIASHTSRLVLWRSPDARGWEQVATFSMPKGDIRDPKLAVIGDRLFLYCLRNDGFVAEPNATSFTVSDDGTTWAPLSACGPEGWLFWRPKTQDGKVWYVGAYWYKHGRSALLRSTNGQRWEVVSIIHDGDFNDETDIEWLPDGRLIATARLEMSGSLFGHPRACTLIATAEPPYERWDRARCELTRLDGPHLFRVGERVLALGRRHVDSGRWLRARGSCFGLKRTALFEVRPEGLTHLTDLPSCGDTGYPGAVLLDDALYVSYYTNAVDRDVRWLHGMFLPSAVRMARIPRAGLSRLTPR